MMASGTSMARDQLLMSQKFTWNHLPSSSTSHGMVGTYSHGIKSEQRQIQLGERVHARHAAQVQRHFARAQHPRVGLRHAGEFEREIRLDGGVHVRRAAVIDVPAAVGQLHGKDVIDGLALPFAVNFPVPMMVRHRVGHERGIHHQFADPVTFGLLQAQQVFLRPQNGRLDFSVKIRLKPGRPRRLRRLNP